MFVYLYTGSSKTHVSLAWPIGVVPPDCWRDKTWFKVGVRCVGGVGGVLLEMVPVLDVTEQVYKSE